MLLFMKSIQSHSRRVKRFEKCIRDLERETNEHPTLHAVLYRIETTINDIAPDERKVQCRICFHPSSLYIANAQGVIPL